MKSHALTPAQARLARWLYRNTDLSMSSLAKRYRVSRTTVRRAVDKQPPYDRVADSALPGTAS